MPSLEKTKPEHIKQKDLAILKNGAIGMYAVQHRVTKEMFVMGSREECFEFYRRYE